MSARPVVLLGAGHAHLHLLRNAPALARHAPGGVVLVTPDDFWYSGLVSGVVAGQYPPEDARIDVASLAARGGVHLVRDRAVAVDPEACSVSLGSGDTLAYELLSVNVGSGLPDPAVPGLRDYAVPAKPIERLTRLPDRIRSAAREGEGPVRVVVVGGGPSGCELALALEARAARDGVAVSVRIVSDAPIVERFPPGATRSLRRELGGRGIEAIEGVRAAEIRDGEVELADGRRMEADVVLAATGLVPPAILRRFGIPLGEDGGLEVDVHLRSVADSRVFAVGDCAWFAPRPLPRVGVFAVRQAPVLLENLVATLVGRPPRPFEPQRHYLLILNLGDGRGLATRGSLYWRGRLAFRLKDWLDRRFLARHRAPSD